MRNILFYIFILCPILMWAQNKDANSQHKLLQQAKPQNVRPNTHPLAQWFPNAGFGLFVHFGLSAVDGGIDLSWGMRANKPWDDGELAPVEYWKLADGWNPKNFKPDKWVKAAAKAGFKYIVFTTKHHDGYTMWPSQYGDFGVKQKMNGRDLVKEVVDACRKYGLKVGLYFSPPDWKFDADYINFGTYKKKFYNQYHQLVPSIPKMPEEHRKKRTELIQNQVRELLTNYGRIDLIWFDGGQGEISNEEVRRLQPGIVINRRNKDAGDYGDSEGVLPKQRFTGWFETCDPCWPSRRWSYSHSDRMDSGDDVIEKLVLLRAWGGNLLANVGPAADGSIPKEALDAWKVIGKWLEHSGESIFDVKGGCYPEKANQPITVKEDAMYVHVFPDCQATIRIRDIAEKPLKAVLLRTGEEINLTYESGTVKFKIPGKMRTRQVDTVKLFLK